MNNKQFVVVVYDISNDKRRTRLHNALLDYGTPVQYSVFEC
jgi:CRISPR-associated protein Cas2